MAHPAIAVFTRKSVEGMLSDGGSGYWILNPRRAHASQYVVCTRNAKSPDRGANETHRAAFLVGEIGEIVETGKDPRGNRRCLINFKKYAHVDVQKAWKNWRNPVRYTTMETLGIDPDRLSFKVPRVRLKDAPSGALTIAAAKEGLAVTFGVAVDAIEIIIRG